MKNFVLVFLFYLFWISCVFWSYWFYWSYDDIFQEETDKNFKEIDREVENYLFNLNNSKNHCFWREKKQNFIDCINDIEKNFEEYSNDYQESCNLILSSTIENSLNQSISAVDAQKFIDTRWKNLCTRLYEFKIRNFKLVAYDILKNNKFSILRDENKLFRQDQRNKYSSILDLFRVNLWYIERLWKKWPSKTK